MKFDIDIALDFSIEAIEKLNKRKENEEKGLNCCTQLKMTCLFELCVTFKPE